MTEYIYISSNNSPFYSNIKTGKVSIVTFIDLYRRWPWYTKVKCTLVQALRLCTGRTAHRGSGGVALLFHDHGTRRWWGVSVTPWPLFTPGKNKVLIVPEGAWVPGPVWTGAENLAHSGIRSPDHPACSQSLYRLHYPAHIVCIVHDVNSTYVTRFTYTEKWTHTIHGVICGIECAYFSVYENVFRWIELRGGYL